MQNSWNELSLLHAFRDTLWQRAYSANVVTHSGKSKSAAWHVNSAQKKLSKVNFTSLDAFKAAYHTL